MRKAAIEVAEFMKRNYTSRTQGRSAQDTPRLSSLDPQHNPAIKPPTEAAQPATPPASTDTPIATWQLVVATKPPGATLLAFDAKDKLIELNQTPASLAWPRRTAADTLVIRFQGRQIAVMPMVNQIITVDFTSHPPVITGAVVVQ